VNDGTIEIRDRNGDNKVIVPAAEAVETLLARI
jgi:prolyl-tRNA synthetase